ncbi:hypothetical protein ZRA01_29800 [Zoogloea ramigera]|uniref:Magnesium transporter n=1 Tax=Zoogloea ramigera TaxID=350 RepID=A0A4Y4D0V3_ZOORA|nr:CorA family divalent cation transporter [Zoogloea ramigera]GEC96907.1 hypothetical protein ZRA01_29800 [Zoogloea ramigera]
MSLEKITELLRKQRLVEGMVHSQSMPRQQLVETMVHRTHLAEIQNLLHRLSSREIGNILEALSPGDARALWQQLPETRENDVLWEVSEPLREHLAGGREPGLAQARINAFEVRDGRLCQVPITCRRDLAAVNPLWIDLLDATPSERQYVGERFGLTLPAPGEATDLEVSSRFIREEHGEIRLHSNFLLDRAGEARSVPVVFILRGGVLFSLRNEELPAFRLQRRRATTQPGQVGDCGGLLVDLYGADVEYSADSLEGIYAAIGQVGRKVLGESLSDEEAASMLATIADEEDLNGRIRSNILDTQRAISFLMRCKVLAEAPLDDARQILRDIESLNNHTAFLFDKINFLMDATIGFININQNRRVSQLTVFGVVFMPINILAGVGGMSEFSMMTSGIPWPLAYGALILSMGLVGWGTYVGLKHVEARKAKKGSARLA